MKACWGSGGIAPRILNLGTRRRWVVSFTPRPLYPQGMSPCYPLHTRLGRPQSWSGRGGEEKNSQPLLGLEYLIIQPVAQLRTTELSWLSMVLQYLTYSFRFNIKNLVLSFPGSLGYGLDDRSSRVRFPAGAGNFSLHHRVQNGSGAHPPSYPMGTRGSFPGSKAAGA
jgi:hypothetical protein